jgi:deoxyribodipyrimidine photo-lyase
MPNTSIWWIRRDLRLTNNLALNAAVNSSDKIIPLFIIDPKLVNSNRMAQRRLDFLWGGLAELDRSLRERGVRLVVRKGQPVDILKSLVEESGAVGIFAEADFSPYARDRDNKVAQNLPLNLKGSPGVSMPGQVLKQDGSPYTIFTPYKKRWMSKILPLKNQKLPAPDRIKTVENTFSEVIPKVSNISGNGHFIPGESEALSHLKRFTARWSGAIFRYSEQRDRMDLDGTSRLSPYFKFGMVSARQAVSKAVELIDSVSGGGIQKGVETWLSELIWRDFYISIMYHFPEVSRMSFRAGLRNIQWVNNNWEYEQWCQGLTGYPIVDAGMRQLAQIGWMHNRARMITASFLVKDLLVDWRWGEAWFMKNLIDGDPASNNGGWQWTAGTGTDAAPYFRVFNPVTQGRKFDPTGVYIRKWVPELENVPDKYIHTPWEIPPEIQSSSVCQIGKDYPQPIVDHSFARQRALEIYKQANEKLR